MKKKAGRVLWHTYNTKKASSVDSNSRYTSLFFFSFGFPKRFCNRNRKQKEAFPLFSVLILSSFFSTSINSESGYINNYRRKTTLFFV